MKTKIRVIFLQVPKNKPIWPYINYDVESKSQEVIARLNEALPDADFSPVIYDSLEQAQKTFEGKEKGKYDGWLMYLTSMYHLDIVNFYLHHARPLIAADDLYAGSATFLHIQELIEQENLPVVTIASSNFEDVIDAVRLLTLAKRLQKTRILLITDNDNNWRGTSEKAIREIFGIETIRKNSRDLQVSYEQSDSAEAESIAKRWIENSKAVIEPSEQEIIRSAKMHLGIKHLLKQYEADAITIDCLGLYYSGRMVAYPCLSFFQLNNEGKTGVCEGDLDSTLCQLIFRYLTGKPAYVSDPVIDSGANQIIYAHCVATNRPEGPGCSPCPYYIRSHAEDHKGASVESLLPLGKIVTTIKINPTKRAMGVYTARTVADIHEEKACRTKLAAEVDTEKLLRNYHMEIFGWHQVTCYGDYRKQMKHLAKLYGLTLYEQDC